MYNKSENALPKIGYLYHYPNLDDDTDTFRLDIFISSIPTEQHFDVLRVHIDVTNTDGTVECMTIKHPWYYEKTARVCPGVVILEDRKGKKEEAFTFGGQLKIEMMESQTKCTLVSSAPILEISAASHLPRLFVDELEIIFAKRRAAFSNHEKYETQLCASDPLDLYQACIKTLIQKFEQFSNKGEETAQFLLFLYSQERRLDAAGLSRVPAPDLADIFKK